ncbi:MAG: beta-ketoacyl synthase [Spirochaetes bacterium GWF1_31_7]|nr:MAG: beta-ketoacyl synthase [Spirochaetes bacterium GWE1_32_154]OHD46497.1 MAG: beta-ketoacyl synthase [Spirochaetes bacterium GWE2_31_10]OHD46730.1 MAG: beta-ketoacyl synthase [Spirochaetes bacterium GWF1_31_7]OHD75555.1 MAG: beta-ketoacyl synthase [Spirochaetes bacterium RIFOXYB1_FULL_32_8]HBD93379.1 beta-ketoacyl synthase [Spirochaetia bacterium]
MNYENRVVVTGMGIISCLGNTIADVSHSLQNGIPGYGIDQERINLGFRSPLTGIIKNFDEKAYLDRKRRKTMSLSTLWAYAASEQAIKDSGLPSDLIASPETGIIFGHDSVAEPSYLATKTLLEEKSSKSIGSGYIFQIMNSTVTMNLSTIFNTKGANWSIAGACASGSHAIGQAAELIRTGQQERMIAGGAQEINYHVMASFDALNAFSVSIENPTMASKPFDKSRDGLVPSGGAASVVLERMDLAMARGATIYGEIVAYSFSSDGDDMSAPNGIGAELAMKKTLKRAGLTPADIQYINAHATATPRGDGMEALAISNLFGNKPLVSSTKSMTGHECWMAGASETIYSLIMIKDKFIAPNINFSEPDEYSSKINIVSKKLDFNLKTVLSNSFGFGGTNSALIIRAVEG